MRTLVNPAQKGADTISVTSDTQRDNPRQASNGASTRTLPCPYCGTANDAQAYECGSCGGVFEPLSRQATQNAMGPWFVRDESNPFSPGCAYETLRRMVARGKVKPETVLRVCFNRGNVFFLPDTKRLILVLNLAIICRKNQVS